MINNTTVEFFESSGGVKVYKLPVEAFPNHITNCYLVLDDTITLIDTGSGWETSNRDITKGFDTLRADFGEKLSLNDVKRVIITHGHIDHFGGVNWVIEETGAELCIHELDASVIHHFKERLLNSTHALHHFLNRSGMSTEWVNTLLQMNKWSKDSFQARPVDFTFHEGQILDSPLVAYHAPGHCSGQVCMQLHDLLFTADHVLSRITPNQAPESITRSTGVGHYLEALAKIKKLEGVRLALGGHELTMENWQERIDDTIGFHLKRLEKTYDLLTEPKSMTQVSTGLFGKQVDYHILLAMLETGAHLEYLYERGRLVIVNIEEMEDDPTLIPLYRQAD